MRVDGIWPAQGGTLILKLPAWVSGFSPRSARFNGWMFLAVSCTIADMEADNRKRLASAVSARRIEKGMPTTKALADRAKLSARMLGDVENGRRDNFSGGAKAQIERALDWRAGSIDAVLAGGDPVPLSTR